MIVSTQTAYSCRDDNLDQTFELKVLRHAGRESYFMGIYDYDGDLESGFSFNRDQLRALAQTILERTQ